MPSLERPDEPLRPSELEPRDDELLLALRLELEDEPDEALMPRSLELGELEEHIRNNTPYEVTRTTMVIEGLCPGCRNG